LTYKESLVIDKVTAFSPLFFSAFQKMVRDPKLSTGMTIVVWQDYESLTCSRTLPPNNYFKDREESTGVGEEEN